VNDQPVTRNSQHATRFNLDTFVKNQSRPAGLSQRRKDRQDRLHNINMLSLCSLSAL